MKANRACGTANLRGKIRSMWRWRAGARFVRASGGTASVEFVLVLPLFTLFLFSIIAFGSTLYVKNDMLNAARERARRMSVAEAPSSGLEEPCTSTQAQTAGTAEFIACTYLVDWGQSFVVEADNNCPTTQEVVVRIIGDAEQAALADVFGFFTGDLEARVVMRREEACA